mgnify:CR=1 FL=1
MDARVKRVFDGIKVVILNCKVATSECEELIFSLQQSGISLHNMGPDEFELGKISY